MPERQLFAPISGGSHAVASPPPPFTVTIATTWEEEEEAIKVIRGGGRGSLSPELRKVKPINIPRPSSHTCRVVQVRLLANQFSLMKKDDFSLS